MIRDVQLCILRVFSVTKSLSAKVQRDQSRSDLNISIWLPIMTITSICMPVRQAQLEREILHHPHLLQNVRMNIFYLFIFNFCHFWLHIFFQFSKVRSMFFRKFDEAVYFLQMSLSPSADTVKPLLMYAGIIRGRTLLKVLNFFGVLTFILINEQ